MTPKEKAKELVDKFCEYSHTDFNYSRGGYQIDTQIQNAKQCALIAVHEILNIDNITTLMEKLQGKIIKAREYYNTLTL